MIIMKMYHVVLLKFAAQKSGRAAELFDALADLKRRLPGFLSFTGGPYSSPEGLNQGFTHGFIMAFQDAAARDHYLFHPDHEKVKQAFLPDLENVIAFDFEGE
jgi:hypothetical protein